MTLRRWQGQRDTKGGLTQMTVTSKQRARASAQAKDQPARAPALRTLPAWKALQKHHERTKSLHLRQLFADDPERGERLAVEAAGIYLDYSKNRITDETLRLLLQLAEESGLRERDRRDVPRRRRSTSRRTAPCCTSRCARRAAPRSCVDGAERRARGPRRARQDGGLRRSRAQRRLEGPHRQAHPQRRQHRHRRLRPRAGDGLRGAAALQRARHDVPLRLQRRRHRLRRSDARSRPRRDAVHRLLEDLHHAGDHDQRAHRARLARWPA